MSPVYSVMCILYKNWKNMISLWTSVKLDEAIEKSFQESRNSIDFLDLDIKSLEKLNNSSVMSHILYYLDPNNADKLLWIKKSQAYDLTVFLWKTELTKFLYSKYHKSILLALNQSKILW